MSDETKKIEDGGPAFPFGQMSEATGLPVNGYHNDGMSLRDYLAAKAMLGYLSNPEAARQLSEAVDAQVTLGDTQRTAIHRIISRRAYLLADAMLAARKVLP